MVDIAQQQSTDPGGHSNAASEDIATRGTSQNEFNASGQATVGISFNLPEATPYIGCLRKTICHLLKAAGVSHEEIEDLEMVIGELATNAARHAKGGNYHVTLELHGSEATVTVVDQGIGFDPATLLDAGASRPDDLSQEGADRIGGFGLPLVRTLTDDFRIERNQPCGMIVRAKKTIGSLASRQ